MQILQLEMHLKDQQVVRGALEKALGPDPAPVTLQNESPMLKVFYCSVYSVPTQESGMPCSRAQTDVFVLSLFFFFKSAGNSADKGGCDIGAGDQALGAVPANTLQESI